MIFLPALSRTGFTRSTSSSFLVGPLGALSASSLTPATIKFNSTVLTKSNQQTITTNYHKLSHKSNQLHYIQSRDKHTKVSAYRRASRSGVFTRAYNHRAHIGIRATCAEYVETGRTIVKQRKFIAKNPAVTTNKHFKLYPGENVKVVKDTSLVAVCSGRVKYTHDVVRNVKIANVMPESREELKEEDLWRYRTEHVRSMEENKVGSM